MTQLRRTITALAVATVATACQSPSDPADAGGPPAKITALPRALSGAEQTVITASNRFAFDLLEALNQTRADSNIFMSPLSASMALGMTMNGAAGNTLAEMRQALGFPSLPLQQLDESYDAVIDLLRALDPNVDFRIANSVWYRRGFPFEETFLTTTQRYFDARVSALDFTDPGAPGVINAWVNESTNGKIEKVIDRIDPLTVMFLINAIYFKGNWTTQFDRSKTRDDEFTTLNGSRVPVKLMVREGQFRFGQSPDAQIVELPYGGDAFVMTLLLPSGGKNVNDLVASLDASTLAGLTQNLTEARATVMLPRFRLTWEAELNDQLKALGMRDAFTERVADFTLMSQSRGRELFVQFVKQNSFVDVNEEGTEAAAVTNVGIGVVSLPPTIRFDRPFFFAIRERLSGTILFVGKIVRPT